MFMTLGCFVFLWLFIYAIWEHTGRIIAATYLSKALVAAAFIPAGLIITRLRPTAKDLGISFRGITPAIVTDSVITVGLLLFLIVLKLVLLKIDPSFFPENVPFFHFGKYPAWEYVTYAVSVIAQEFLSRGVLHGMIRRSLCGRHAAAEAILFSSLMFSALHIQVGFVYMLGATVLLGLLGIVYDRQKTIWGLCIPHYILGWAIGLLGFVAY